MSKIIYLLGAGASFGERSKESKTTNATEDKHIVRGVPIVSEFKIQINHIIDCVSNNFYDKNLLHPANNDMQKQIIIELEWLKDICGKYPTVDTYARLLFVTGNIDEYTRLKNAISLFLSLCQNQNTRDIRYDGFIASIIDDNGRFPNDISILSWNYDSQFEFAYTDYINESNMRNINEIWQRLNVLSKTINDNIADGFGVIKLNGTAFYYDNTKEAKLWDVFYNTHGMSITTLLHMHCIQCASNVINSLSFAWEDHNNKNFQTTIIDRVNDTKVLVVIGYSFPYVNRKMDKLIIKNMNELDRVYIQDPNAEGIKEVFYSLMTEIQKQTVKFSLFNNTAQFVIPDELE